jgi:hypothetical protein
MGIVALRIFIYSILPLIMAAVHVGLDKTGRSRERKLEIFLLYLLGVGVAGSGIGGFSVTFPFRISGQLDRLADWKSPFNWRSPLPIWHSVFSALSPWVGAMDSVRPRSSP